MTCKLVISEDNLRVYNNGSLEYNGTYEIEDDRIVYDRHNGSAIVLPFDKDSRKISLGQGKYYSKTSSSTSSYSSNSSNSSSSGSNREQWLRKRLNELENEFSSSYSEMMGYRSRGVLDPVNAMYYKQNLLSIRDQQIDIASQLGEYSLVDKYRQHKRTIESAFRAAGF